MLNLQPPHGRRIVVYDLEIKEPIEGPVTWDRKDLMGISVGVAYDYSTGFFKVFLDDNIDDLGALLNGAEIVSGFNIVSFDNALLATTLAAAGKISGAESINFNKMLDAKSYDLLIESRKASGWTPAQRFPKAMKLDDHLKCTFGAEHVKADSSAEAPLMYKRGEIGRLVTKCIDDVKRECMLFEAAWHGKPVSTPLHAPRVLDRARFSSAPPPLPPTPPELAQTARDNW